MGRPRSIILRRLTAASVVALLAASLTLAGASTILANEAPFAHASTTGVVGCSEPGGAACQWAAESPAAAPTWHFDDKRDATMGVSTAEAAADIQFTELDEADGTLGALTIVGQLSVDITGVETSESVASISADFLTRAKSLGLAGSADVKATGTDSLGSAATVQVSLDCGAIDTSTTASAGFDIPEAADSATLTQNVDVLSEGATGECDLNIAMRASGGTSRGASAPQHTTATAKISLTILAGAGPSPSPSGCALSGIITDGEITTDLHANPMADIPVQLHQDAAAVGDAVTTDAGGRYCIPEGVAQPGDYELQATLRDARTNPPLLETDYQVESDALFVSMPVHADQFGSEHLDFSFTATTERPWLSDVANIQWQSQRYLDWILDELEIAPALVGSTRIITFTGGDTRYDPAADRISIAGRDSTFASRDGLGLGPTGLEWHELTHHLMRNLGVGMPAFCPLDDPEGGWNNPSSCVSLDEGVALFLPGLAARDLSDREDLSFGFGGNLEDNSYFPWSRLILADHVVEREPFAVAQLLWDLTDDTPLERAPIQLPFKPSSYQADETVAFGVDQLVHLLVDERPATVEELFVDLAKKVDPDVIATQDDIDGDGSLDVNRLDELLLMHGFHSVDNELLPSFQLGTTVGRTSHLPDGTGGLVPRHAPLALPGATIQFDNPGSQPVTFGFDVTYPATTSHFALTVAPGVSRTFAFEPPPYWRGVLPDGAALPECGAADQLLVTLVLSAPGVTSRTLDSCAYLHLAAAASGSALAFSAGTGPTGAIVATSPIVLGGAALLVIVAVGAGFLFLRRRSRASSS